MRIAGSFLPKHAKDAGIKICDVSDSFCHAYIYLQGDCANFQDTGYSLFDLIETDAHGNTICVACAAVTLHCAEAMQMKYTRT